MGISNGIFYNWHSKYAGLEVNEAQRLRELESENAKLKKPLADKLLEVEAMKDVLSKKWWSLTVELSLPCCAPNRQDTKHPKNRAFCRIIRDPLG